MKNILLCLVLTFVNVIVGYGNIDKTNNKIYPKFQILETEYAPGKYLLSDRINTLQTSYDFKKLPKTRPALDRMITLTTDLFPSGFILREPLYLYLPPTEYPLKIFLEGQLIYERGNAVIEKGYTSRIHYAASILLPSSFFRQDSKTELAIQLYPREGEIAPFQEVFIANAECVEKTAFLKNFFGYRFIQSFAMICLFIFIYCLFLFFFKKNGQNLSFFYFALINLFFVTAYLNNIFNSSLFSTFALEKLSRVSFVVLTFVSILFTLEFTGIFQKRREKLTFTVFILCLFFCGLLILKKDIYSLNETFNGLVSYTLLLGLILNVVLAALAFKKSGFDKKYLVLAFIYFLHVLFVVYDAYYFSVLQKKPFIMMIPFTFFLIDVGMIWLLAKQQIKTNQALLVKTKELEDLNESLEKKVFQRTKELQEANDTKDKFFSIIAHDLKGPIGSLRTLIDLAAERKEIDENETQEIFALLKKASKNTYYLLDNLLAWARSQKNEMFFEPEEIELRKIVDETLNLMEMILKEKSIGIKAFIPEHLKIVADYNMILMVLRNVLSNAVKFSYERGEVEITAAEEVDFVTLSVRDHGTGMNPEIIPLIFTINRHKQQQGTKGERGSGLGLILCKEFMERNAGLIQVFSVPGKGTSFMLKFPKN